MANRGAVKRKSGPRWYIWLALGLVLAGCAAAAAYFLGLWPVQSAQSAGVQTSVARRGTLRLAITGAGTYAAGESADLNFSVDGTLAELDVALGQTVAEGQVLARLGGTQELEAAVSQARVNLLQAQSDLKELQENASVALAQAYVDWVKAKGAYESAATASQRTAYARCSQDVNIRYAETLKRAQERLAKQTPGTEAYTDARNDVDTATANYNYCIGYTSGEIITASATADLAKQSLDKAAQHYDLLKSAAGIDPDQLALAEDKVDEAEKLLEQAERNLAGATLKAPIAGTVTYLAAGPGVRVDSKPTFLTISDLTQPVMEVSVDEADLMQFVKGSRVQVVFDALPDQVFSGTLVEVLPQLQNSFMTSVLTGTVALDANTALESLPLGLNATVEVISKEVPDALLIPLEALHAQPDGTYTVTVVDSSGAQVQRSVEIGVRDSTSAQVTSGLEEGERVVISIDSTVVTARNENQQMQGMPMPGGVPGGGMPPGGMP